MNKFKILKEKPITIYILRLENDKFFITKSIANLGQDEWTKQFPFKEIIDIIDDISNGSEFEEDKYTKIYMKAYGINNVRGGSYTTLKLEDYELQALKKELNPPIILNSSNPLNLSKLSISQVPQVPQI